MKRKTTSHLRHISETLKQPIPRLFHSQLLFQISKTMSAAVMTVMGCVGVRVTGYGGAVVMCGHLQRLDLPNIG